MKTRYRPYNPEESYFTLIDSEDIKQHNPLLKVIDSFVEEHMRSGGRAYQYACFAGVR